MAPKTFAITGSDLTFVSAQADVPVVEVVRYQTDGTPIYGYFDPAAPGGRVELGKLGAFDLMNTPWAGKLPAVVTNGVLFGTTTPAGANEPLGLRNVQGLFNNLSGGQSAEWGSAFAPFSRNVDANFGLYVQQVDSNTAFVLKVKADPSQQALVNALDTSNALYGLMSAYEKSLVQDSTYGEVIDSATRAVGLAERYANPFFTVWDYTPRMISQTVDSYAAAVRTDQASGGATFTDVVGSSALSLYQAFQPDGTLVIGGYDAAGNPKTGGAYGFNAAGQLGLADTTTFSYHGENFVRNLNTLPGDPSLTGWQTIFGQFFDHGLDFISKGGNQTPVVDAQGNPTGAMATAKIRIPLAPTDPLYNAATGQTYLTVSRATVLNPQAAGADGMFRTADDVASPGADGLYGTADDVIGATNPEFQNNTSPYIDQSQTYGSDDSTTNLLREWVLDPASGKYVAGMRMLDGTQLKQAYTRTNPDGSVAQVKDTLPTINELRRHIVATGRDDISFGDLGNLRARNDQGKVLDLDPNTAGTQVKYTGHTLLADSQPFYDARLLSDPLAGLAGHTNALAGMIGVQRPAGDTTSPQGSFASDYVYINPATSGPSFGQSTAFGLLNPAAADEIQLRALGSFYIAGDGRVNENMALTAVHHVWHENHNYQVDNVLYNIAQQQAADPTKAFAHQFQNVTNKQDAAGNYLNADNSIAWNQEKVFQSAVFINQMEYQHVAIDQFARGMTPNIPLFVMYDSGVNADVTVEFSQGAYRYGHSQLRETLDALDPNGSLTAAVQHFTLESSFLNPKGFEDLGPAALAMGMSRQFSSEIDEIVTPALQQNLLNQAQDLAAINIARGRDVGIPPLNELRRQLSGGMDATIQGLQDKLAANPGDKTLTETLNKTLALQAGLMAYNSWSEFQAGMQHPEAVANFIAAYAFDGDLAKAQILVDVVDGLKDPTALTAAELALLGPGVTQSTALQTAFEFMNGGNQAFEKIDAWVGGLAEKHVFLGQLGPTFDAIFCDQMTRLINGDRFYYFWRLQLDLPTFSALSSAVTTEQFKDVIERTTGALHLVGDVFLAADSYVELGETPIDPATGQPYTAAQLATLTGAQRDHKYGDLVATNNIGVYSHAGNSENANGFTVTIAGQQYINDARPDIGTNPDGTAIQGFNAHEVIGGTNLKDLIDAGDGDDTIYGGAGDDILKGNAGADHIYGEDGNDRLYGGALPDFMDGGKGDDILEGGDDADVLIGSEGNDRLYGQAFTDELHGNAGDDYVDGGLDADFIYGGEGQDTVVGGEGLDTTYGEWGDDRMFAGAGPDQLFGGDGDDILNAGTGGSNLNLNVDEAIGEGGYNMVSFSDVVSTLNVVADLNFQNINFSKANPFNQLWTDISALEGGRNDDQIIGDFQDNWLIGGGGSDLLFGGAGDDLIVADSVYLQAANALLTANGETNHFVDLQKSFPNFRFGDNTTVGALDVSYTASLDGTKDAVVYAGARKNFDITALYDSASNFIGLKFVDKTGAETSAKGDLVLGIEYATFGYDFLTANANSASHAFVNANALPGVTYGVEQLIDYAPTGSLSFTTSEASYSALVFPQNYASFNPAAPALFDRNNISLTNPTGAVPANAVTQSFVDQNGVALNLTLGNLVLSATGGQLFRQKAVYTDAGGFTDTFLSPVLSNAIVGTRAANTLTGTDSTTVSDYIFGGGSADTLNGGAGDDYLSGGAGDDALNGGDGIDTANFAGVSTALGNLQNPPAQNLADATFALDANNNLQVTTSNGGTDTLTSIEKLRFTDATADVLQGSGTVTYTGTNRAIVIGSAGNDVLNAGPNADFLFGLAGDDTLKGGAGNDFIDGGTGYDVANYAITSYSRDKIGISGGNITITTTGEGTDSLRNIERIHFSDNTDVDIIQSNALTITVPNPAPGNNGISFVVGGAADQTITGGTGNDEISGAGGNDVINGGAGTDTSIYSGASSAALFGLSGANVQVTTRVLPTATNPAPGTTTNPGGLAQDVGAATSTPDGTDTLSNIEKLQFTDGTFDLVAGATSAGDTLSYSGINRALLFGGGGNDSLTGGSHDDVLTYTASGSASANQTGGGGRDFMDGGANDSLGDRAVINGDASTEKIRIYAYNGAANSAQRTALSNAGFTGFNANTKIVILRAIQTNGLVNPTFNNTNYAVIAELNNIEEITVNLAGQLTLGPIPVGTQQVSVFGDFSTTGLRTNTITIETEGNTVVDVTGMLSEHRVVVESSGNGNSIIGQRPQDILNQVVAPPAPPVDSSTAPAPGEPAEEGKALHLGLNIVKDPVFPGDATNDLVLRRFGNAQEQGSKFYLAITAESLRNAAINSLDVTVNLGQSFADVFDLKPGDIHFNDAMAVQRRVQVLNTADGPSIRFEGAGLDALASGQAINDTTVLAYIELQARPDIDQLIQADRIPDQYGFLNQETFSVPLNFKVDANVDQVVFSDLRSLRDLGAADVLVNPDLELTARAAQAELTTNSVFDLGTDRLVTKPGEGAHTNLIRSGDTVVQISNWQNTGEFTFTDLKITDHSNAVATVTSLFNNASATTAELGWSDQPGQGASASITSSFHITGAAGTVLDTTEAGFSLDAYGGFHWDTRQMDQFDTSHLITFQGDLNYDGAVSFKDLAFLNAGAATGVNPHDVDANFDGAINMLDLAVIDADWGKSLHTGADAFLGSQAISMAELFQQDGRTWDSSAFQDQNTIEAGSASGGAYTNVLTDQSAGLISAASLQQDVLDQWQQQHLHALASV